MTRLTAQQFQDADGTADWRVLGPGASAWFVASSHLAGAALVRRVVETVPPIGPVPDLDLRPTGVRVRTAGLTSSDLDVARRVSALAHELGLDANASSLSALHVSIDAMTSGAVLPFWQAALGYEAAGHDLLRDPRRRHPRVWFQPMDAPRPLRNRIHLDVGWPHDVAGRRVASAVAAGGRVVHDPGGWHNTVADPDGNEVDLFPLTDGDGLTGTPGLEDWRSMLDTGTAYPADLARGVAVVEAAARLADEAGVGLLVGLRPEGVEVWTGKDCWTPQHEDVARGIQVEARDAGLVADPTQVRDLQIAIDARDVERVGRFWQAALGYRPLAELVPDGSPADLYDPHWLNPPLMFQPIDPALDPDHAARAAQRGRIHLDLFVPDDQAEARVAAAVAAGGRVVYDAEAPDWWTLADPEGNELDIAVVVGREERAAER